MRCVTYSNKKVPTQHYAALSDDRWALLFCRDLWSSHSTLWEQCQSSRSIWSKCTNTYLYTRNRNGVINIALDVCMYVAHISLCYLTNNQVHSGREVISNLIYGATHTWGRFAKYVMDAIINKDLCISNNNFIVNTYDFRNLYLGKLIFSKYLRLDLYRIYRVEKDAIVWQTSRYLHR